MSLMEDMNETFNADFSISMIIFLYPVLIIFISNLISTHTYSLTVAHYYESTSAKNDIFGLTVVVSVSKNRQSLMTHELTRVK